MTLIYSFIFCGLICLIAQIIMDNTNLTPGHLTSLFTVIGSILAVFNFYDKSIDKVGAGANLLIVNFGNNLTNYAYLGYLREGVLGIFKNMLTGSSLAITSTIIIAAILTLFTSAKD